MKQVTALREFIRFEVLGRPQPQGSIRSFILSGNRAVLTSDNKQLKPWRQAAGWMAKFAMQGKQILPRSVPVILHVTYYLRPPTALPKRITKHLTKPDLDKLLRACFDACSGIVWTDDSQVFKSDQEKQYGLPERTEFIVEVIE